MTVKTKFKTSGTLLYNRCELHKLVDLFWKNGEYTRTEIYEILSHGLGSASTLHISDLEDHQLKSAADIFMQLLETNDIAACRKCTHAKGYLGPGIPVCTLTGKPFCYGYLNSQTPINQCKDFIQK